ncbi:MAG TPA: geranylgeranyl reductase family protein [Acidimicrobiia bacterium]|jgi:geranylgeranyl reductase family protein
MTSPDVLVVGGGPGGAAAAYWLAKAGLSVLVAEKKAYPRDKTCGDGLTPRAVKQLIDMGFDFDVPELHRITGLRAYAGDLTIELPWPEHSIYPSWGAVIRRADLDMQVATLAEKQGAIVRQRTEAVAVVESGRLAAVELREKDGDRDVVTDVVTPKVTVIADGSLSRFGRALGTSRRRDYPYGMAIRAYYESSNSKDSMLESQLNILDAEGRTLPGYGWIFPLGDGTINVGAGVLSSFKGWKDVNTSRVLDAYVGSLPGYWEVTAESQLTRPVGGKLPMALSVGPRVGSNWIAIGDAAGAVNPFNGEGIDYAYETGRLAAVHVGRAIGSRDMSLLHRYSQALEDEYSDYNRVARAFVIAIGNPKVMKTLTRLGLRSRPLMEWVLKVMANLLEPEDQGMSERVYHAIERVVKVGPDPLLKP